MVLTTNVFDAVGLEGGAARHKVRDERKFACAKAGPQLEHALLHLHVDRPTGPPMRYSAACCRSASGALARRSAISNGAISRPTPRA
jgi:hypothetical protein